MLVQGEDSDQNPWSELDLIFGYLRRTCINWRQAVHPSTARGLVRPASYSYSALVKGQED